MNSEGTTWFARNILSFFYHLCWRDATKWLNNVQNSVLEEAGIFLIQEGYLSKDKSVLELGKAWPELSKTLWNHVSPEEFYLSWHGKIGAANIIANILDQLSRSYLASALMKHLNGFKGKALDFGCGTATISLAWQKDFAPDSNLILSDIENLSRRYVEWRIAKTPLCSVEFADIHLKSVQDNSLDALLCIDVLEHLPNPSEIFCLIDRKLKIGGVFFLQAPWGGFHEHLDEAITDWYDNGGHKRLTTCYRKVNQIKPFCKLSGIFLKEREMISE
jgi:ubiquinone/menaquinone biosynthesis C-methylase UbiE